MYSVLSGPGPGYDKAPLGAAAGEAVIIRPRGLNLAQGSGKLLLSGEGRVEERQTPGPAEKGEERPGKRRPPGELRHPAPLNRGGAPIARAAQQNSPLRRRRGRRSISRLTECLRVGAGTLHHETPPYRFSVR